MVFIDHVHTIDYRVTHVVLNAIQIDVNEGLF